MTITRPDGTTVHVYPTHEYRKVKEARYSAFADELAQVEKVAYHFIPKILAPRVYAERAAERAQAAARRKEKQAGFMRDLGSRIRFSSTGRATETFFKNPLGSLRNGIASTFGDRRTGRVKFMAKGNRLMPGLFVAGTAMSAANALKKDDPNQVGPGRGERVGRFLGGTITGLAATPFGGIGTGMALGMAGDAVGGRLGKGVDRLRGYKSQRVSMQTAQQAQPQQAPPTQSHPQGVA